jgi:membrane protein YqaA with SNARE-associated domain
VISSDLTIEEIIAVIVLALQNPIFVKYGLAGLFINGILASTAVPLPTEITVSALLASGQDRLPVFAVLVVGSYIGGFLGYWIGRSGSRMFQFMKGKEKNQDQDKGDSLLSKYGWIAIAGSAWVPIVGDFIPIVAGTKKYDLKRFAIALSIGKTTRALAVVYVGGFFIGRLVDV